MPALQADIARGTRDAETVTWSNPTTAARYPNARDGSQAPAVGYFDDPSDAAAVLGHRGALIGAETDRFAVPVADLIWPDLAALPCARLVDSEMLVDAVFLDARFEVDLDAETTTLELFG